MELSFWAATDVGRKREHNEDNFLVDKKLSLFVVADGMGGHASGEVASHIAVHEFRNAIEAKQDVLEAYAKGDAPIRHRRRSWRCSSTAVQAAGVAIFERGKQEPDKRGHGDHHLRPAGGRRPRASSPTSATAASTCSARRRSSSSPRTTRSSTSSSAGAR